MPVIPEYDAKEQLDPGRMPTANFDNSAEVAAARQQGAAIAGIGAQISDAAQRWGQMQDQKAQFNTRLAMDKLIADQDGEDQQALQKAPQDGSGITQERTAALKARTDAFLTNTVPAHLREEYAMRLATVQEKYHTKYASTEATMLGKFSVEQISKDLDSSKQAVANDPNALDERLTDMRERLKVAPGIPDAQKPAIAAAMENDLKMVAAGKLHATDPGAMAGMLGLKYQGKGGSSDKEGAAMSFFMSKGWTKEQAAGIVGNLIQESGLNTGARNAGDGADGSDSIGIAQWNAERAAAYKKFAADQGKPVGDLQTQLAFVDQELRTTHRGAGDKLKNAKTATEAAAAVVTDYERPKGSNKGAASSDGWGNRLGHANRLAGGNVQVASASMASDAMPEGSRPVAADPRFASLSYEDKLKLIKGAELGQAQEFKLAEQMATMKAADDEFKRKADVDQMQYAAADGKLTIEELDSKRGMFKNFEEYNGVKKLIDKSDTDDKLNAQGIAKLAAPGSIWTADDKNLLSAMDRKAGVPEAIQKGDQTAVTRMASQFRDTGMISAEVKQTFEGIPRSGSPQQVQFAMSALDQMYRSNPNSFEEAFGTKTRQALTMWQSMIDKDPKAFQEELKRAGDPTTLKARENVEKEGRKIAEGLDDKKVVAAFDEAWFSDPGKPYTPPEAPGMAILKVEFANVFAEEYRIAQGDEKKAQENTVRRMKETWIVSPSSGGRLVKYAPEVLLDKGFPRVDGSGDWLTDQVKAEVAKSGGRVPVGGTVPGAEAPPYALFASEETKAEIDAVKAGRPLPDGRKSPEWTLVYEDPKTGLKQMKPFSFNVETAIDAGKKRAAELQAEHDRSGHIAASDAALAIVQKQGGSQATIDRLKDVADQRRMILDQRNRRQ